MRVADLIAILQDSFRGAGALAAPWPLRRLRRRLPPASPLSTSVPCASSARFVVLRTLALSVAPFAPFAPASLPLGVGAYEGSASAGSGRVRIFNDRQAMMPLEFS